MDFMKASLEGTTIEQIVNGYDWKGLGAGTVVDVGGALGHLGIAIAESFPALQVIIQDIPTAIALGRQQLPSHLYSRVSFMPHDFYLANPVKSASIYFFSRVIHDWPDESATKILRAVVESMGPESKIVIADKVMPEQPVGGWDERMVRDYDLIMMALNGKERTSGEWRELVEKTDERLWISNVVRPEGALGSLIEVSWRRENSPMLER